MIVARKQSISLWRSIFLWTCLAPNMCLWGQARHALVIGNDNYPGNALQNARSDAISIHEALLGKGFDSTLVLDADRKTLETRIDRFVGALQPHDAALLYYAGHGIQLNGENYLVPTDFKASNPTSVNEEGYALSLILERMTSHGASVQIVILDACRDNPFNADRSMKGGWSAFNTATGTFLAFGTSPGSTASDDPAGGHGLFTKNLLPLLAGSDLEIEEMFRQVRQAVIRESNGRQVPWTASSLVGEFYMGREHISGAASSALQPAPKESSLVSTPRSLGLLSADGIARSSYTFSDAQSGITNAIELIRGTKLNEAVGLLNAVALKYPNATLAFHLLGMLLHHLGRDQDAQQVLARDVALNPADAEGQTYLCALKVLTGEETERDCAMAVADSPTAEAYLVLAASLVETDEQRAYSSVSKAIDIEPSDLAYALRGNIEARQGLVSRAEQSYALASESAAAVSKSQ